MCENGEEAGFLFGAEGGGCQRVVAGEVKGEESGEKWVTHVELAAAEEEGPPQCAAGDVDSEIRELEAAGGLVAVEGRSRRHGRRGFKDGRKVGTVDEDGPALKGAFRLVLCL